MLGVSSWRGFLSYSRHTDIPTKVSSRTPLVSLFAISVVLHTLFNRFNMNFYSSTDFYWKPSRKPRNWIQNSTRSFSFFFSKNFGGILRSSTRYSPKNSFRNPFWNCFQNLWSGILLEFFQEFLLGNLRDFFGNSFRNSCKNSFSIFFWRT